LGDFIGKGGSQFAIHLALVEMWIEAQLSSRHGTGYRLSSREPVGEEDRGLKGVDLGLVVHLATQFTGRGIEQEERYGGRP
jgi:hypothetical protein